MLGQRFELTAERCDAKTGIKAYRSQFGKDTFHKVRADFESSTSLKTIKGSLMSAYANHQPKHTYYMHNFKETVDWIFHNKNMRVVEILE